MHLKVEKEEAAAEREEAIAVAATEEVLAVAKEKAMVAEREKATVEAEDVKVVQAPVVDSGISLVNHARAETLAAVADVKEAEAATEDADLKH